MEAIGDSPRTLFEKIWSRHRVVERDDGQTLLYVDRHLLHDGGATAFDVLRKRGMTPRAPERAFATPDHYVATDSRAVEGIRDPRHREMVEELARNTAEAGIRMFGLGDPNQGIVHVVGPETGLSQPGLLLVCGDRPHLDARRPGRARLRHRQHGGDARAGDADAVAAQAEDAPHHGGWRAGGGVKAKD
jgi:3-isopropylmalate/(R)-2-methylmalate dehydratase large subunit